jgi:mRNA-degrading endonuclease RelE of RelBE toxin-antitoxin system
MSVVVSEQDKSPASKLIASLRSSVEPFHLLDVEEIQRSLLETGRFDSSENQAVRVPRERLRAVLDRVMKPDALFSEEAIKPIISVQDAPPLMHSLGQDVVEFRQAPSPRQAKSKKQWLVDLTPSFIKSIQKIDNKLKGRVMEATSRISRNPLTVKGDTVTPLTGDKNGLWRYRIGDYRLVYFPENIPPPVVTFLKFLPRGEVYS